jgi:hypothetical protein
MKQDSFQFTTAELLFRLNNSLFYTIAQEVFKVESIPDAHQAQEL